MKARDVLHPHHRHVQRSGNRCGGEGQDVDQATQLFQLLLVSHSEALFLVDDDQSEVLEIHITGEQSMGADQNIDLTQCRSLQHICLFLA